MKKNLVNEYGLLKSVIVHTPGIEHHFVRPDNLNPEDKENYLLFDDILYLEKAQQEHYDFKFVIQEFMQGSVEEFVQGKEEQCFELTKMLLDVLCNEKVEKDFISDMREIYNSKGFDQGWYEVLRDFSLNYDPSLSGRVFTDLDKLEKFIEYVLAGYRKEGISPLPNIMFTRDLGISIGNSMIITWASKKVRNPENIIAKHIIKNHSLFAKCNIYDFHENHPDLALEGGDVTLINEEVIAIGVSERTSKASVEAITPFLYENGIKYIMCFKMPEERRFMHLDTIFSIININEAIVFHPFFRDGGAKELSVDIITTGKNGPTSTSTFFANDAFRKLDIDFNYIICGGEYETSQNREQWTDGANAFCLSPGKIILYDRNPYTLEELERHGYKIITLNLKYKGIIEPASEVYKNLMKEMKKNQKVAIAIESGELSRGRGGPRCMTMPISRIK